MITIKKNRNGITLIELIITIIVLLILAGVTIITLIGENGILNRAKSAKEISVNSQNNENVILDDYADKVDSQMIGTTRGENENVVYIKPTIESAIADSFVINTGLTNVNNIQKLQYYVDDKCVHEGTELSYTVTGVNVSQNYNVYVKAIGYSKENSTVVAKTVDVPTGYAILKDTGILQAIDYEDDALSGNALDGNPSTYIEYQSKTVKLKVDSSAKGKNYKVVYTRQTGGDYSKAYFLDENGNKITGTNFTFTFTGSGWNKENNITVPDNAVWMCFTIDWSDIHCITRNY